MKRGLLCNGFAFALLTIILVWGQRMAMNWKESFGYSVIRNLGISLHNMVKRSFVVGGWSFLDYAKELARTLD
jgi:hypothetical protein